MTRAHGWEPNLAVREVIASRCTECAKRHTLYVHVSTR
jgi:hypothetical protein